MLAQLHWQNPANLEETIFLGQNEYPDSDRFNAWACELIERRGSECPKGWMALVCTEDSPLFVRSATESKGG